jgi:hypothetical protein
MKTIFLIKGYKVKLARTTLIAASFATIGSGLTQAGTPETEAAPVEPDPLANWANFTVGGFAVNGDDAAFQRRFSNNGDFYGGIDSFHVEQEIGDSGLFTADGHALFGLEDYEVDLSYEKDGLGYINAGYREFRTWYDPSGGIETLLSTDAMELDRGEIWFETGLRMDDLPEITFGYTHRWRDGMKDSTMWQTNQAPAYYNIDETSDIFLLDITHTIKNTDLALSLRYQVDEIDNSHRASGEPKDDARDVVDSDMFSSSLSSQTRLNDRMLLSFAYMFTTLDTDLNGSSHDQNETTPSWIFGGSDFSQQVANASFWWNPIDDLVFVPSVRAEWQNINGATIERNIAGVVTGNGIQNSGIDILDITEEFEIRYSGFENALLYSRFEWTQGDKDSTQFELGRNGGAPRLVDVDTDDGKYILGANYYPMSGLSLSAQYYYRKFDQEYSSNDLVTRRDLGAQILEHNFDTNDFNLRLTWRALSNLTLVSRYDYQQTTIENRAEYLQNLPLGPRNLIESADITSHIFSQSATWMPMDRLYVQGFFSYVMAETDTPADIANPNVSRDSDNDYLTASLNAGYALDDKTDITAGYSYYYADNYAAISPVIRGFGTSIEEHVFSLSLNRRINANMVWNLGYGYYKGNDGAVDGFNDFDAHMVSTGLQVRF